MEVNAERQSPQACWSSVAGNSQPGNWKYNTRENRMTVPTQSLSLLLTFAYELADGLGYAFSFTTRDTLARNLVYVIYSHAHGDFSKMLEMGIDKGWESSAIEIAWDIVCAQVKEMHGLI